MKKINSRQNAAIKEICALHESKGRDKYKKYIGQGLRVIKTLIDSGQTLQRIYTTTKHLSFAKKLVGESIITLVPEEVLKKMSTTTTASGIIGVFSLPEQPPLSSLEAGLVLVTVSDPGNMGTLIRTAAAMNIHHVVCIDTVDPYNPKVIQSTAGTIGFVKLYQTDWATLLHHAKHIPLCALVVSGGKKPDELSLKKSLLIVGGEAHGIPQEYIEQCTHKLTLPMPGGTESLNAAVAGSIALYLGWSQ